LESGHTSLRAELGQKYATLDALRSG